MVTIRIRKLFLPTLVTTGRSSDIHSGKESFFNLSTENQAIEDEENQNGKQRSGYITQDIWNACDTIIWKRALNEKPFNIPFGAWAST